MKIDIYFCLLYTFLESVGKEDTNMKYVKYLVVLLAVTTITSMAGVKADNNPYYWNAVAPKLNGLVDSGSKTKDYLTTQEIRWTQTERSLDIILMQPTGAYMSDWKFLVTGEDIIFSNDRAMYVGSDYKLRVDSRIHYLNDTSFSLQWYIH